MLSDIQHSCSKPTDAVSREKEYDVPPNRVAAARNWRKGAAQEANQCGSEAYGPSLESVTASSTNYTRQLWMRLWTLCHCGRGVGREDGTERGTASWCRKQSPATAKVTPPHHRPRRQQEHRLLLAFHALNLNSLILVTFI